MSGLSFGFGSSKSKNTSYIAPEDKARQLANYEGAQGLNPNYSPTSASQIQGFMSPYIDNVVNTSLGALDRSRQMAVNHIGDQAQAAHAFGGSRHGVAEALTNGEYANQAGLLSAGLYNSGYGQALGAAQDENRFSFLYPLQRQGLLNSTLAGVTPQTYNKGKNSGFNIGWSGSGGGGFGGGGGDGGYQDLLALAGG
jgi:hypothetical protein